MSSFRDSLHVTLLEAASGLPGVASRKMFGCHALFRGSQIFALVWKDGRLGVRLPDVGAFDALADEAGAVPWTIAKDARRVTMSKWLLVPEAWNDGGEELEAWVRKAHALAGGAAATKPPAAAKKKAPAAAMKKAPAARTAAAAAARKKKKKTTPAARVKATKR